MPSRLVGADNRQFAGTSHNDLRLSPAIIAVYRAFLESAETPVLAIDAYKSGRLTVREFARALGLDVWGAHDLLAAEGVAIAQGDRSESRADLEALTKSLKIKKGRSS